MAIKLGEKLLSFGTDFIFCPSAIQGMTLKTFLDFIQFVVLSPV